MSQVCELHIMLYYENIIDIETLQIYMTCTII